ncbi:MAG: PIG-L family deacetylase [Solirubrobacteraceae bacterium]
MSQPIVILSPHPDDAALSCWRLLSGPGEVAVINLFAGVPLPGRTGWWDAAGGARDSPARMRQRLQEDQAALALAGRRAINLDFLDDQYRRSPPDPAAVSDALRTVIPASAHLYAPAALGAQPDHLAARHAALTLRGHTAKLSLYADLPHASANGWPAWVTNSTPRAAELEREWDQTLASTGIRPDAMRVSVYPLAQSEHARKLAALRAYATQLELLEHYFHRSLADPSLLGYEVDWELPAEKRL